MEKNHIFKRLNMASKNTRFSPGQIPRKFCSLKHYWKYLQKIYPSSRFNTYEFVKTDDGRRMYKHRFILEKELGRKLFSTEVVHHKNGNKLDNRPSNLELTTQSKHIHEHFGTFEFGRAKPISVIR